MNKKIVILMIFLFFMAFAVTLFIVNNSNNRDKNEITINEENTTYVSDTVTDECIENPDSKTVNSADERASPNALLILKKYYKTCNHTINEYVELPQEIVNMTQDEVQDEYKDWELIGFSSTEITLYKELESQCGEHYLLKAENGKIVIYRLDESGNEIKYEETDISTEFLTETDLIKIDNGFEVYGKEELNEAIEDFE